MLGIVEKTAAILLRPTDTFQQLREESFGNAFLHYGILLVIYAILSSLFSLAGFLFFLSWSPLDSMMPRSWLLPAVVFPSLVVGILLFFIIGLFLGGAILHLFVLLVGGRKGVEQTLKAVMYSATPIFVLGWIPLIGFLTLIYALFLEILAVRELQEVSTGRAILAVLLPFFLLLVLVILGLLFFLIASSTTGPGQISGISG